MHPMVADRIPSLAGLCAKHKVSRMEIFGSAALAEGDGAPIHDFDFLVEFASATPEEHSNRYFGLLEDLEPLFRAKVDLVEAGAMKNPYFIRRVNESRKLVGYAA